MSEVEHKLEAAYTVRQLRRALQDLPDDARVLFVCNYGDYHNTQQALPISELLEVYSSDLGESAYSQSGVCLLEDGSDEPEDMEKDIVPVLILRS